MLNKKILEGLFRQHYSEMFHLARTLLGADEEAEDIVQDVFVRLMETDIIPEAEGTYETRVEAGNLGDIVVWGSDGANYQNAVTILITPQLSMV